MSDLIQSLTRTMDVASARQQILASNMANVDTPGYRTRDIDFAQELRRAVDGPATSVLTGSNVQGLIERPDGNNVSIERETLAMAETQMRFRTAAQLIKSEFHLLSSAINEGK